ncbi:MAG: hypothetical protein GXP27_15295, partial [Planctomycetes bacterium]|nr:hypothetical protein [Planctomycetota bacterium]
LRETQPAPTITGFTLIGQRDVAIVCASRQAATIVGTVIVKETPGPAVVTRKNWGAHSGQLCLIDSRIEFRKVPKAVAVWAESGLYLRNVYVRGAKTLIRQSGQPALQAPTSTGRSPRRDDWVLIEEYAGTATQSIRARRWDGRVYTYPSVIYVDGKRLDRPTLARVKSGVEPPADLQSRHLWDKDFPHWQLDTAVNVRQAPYNAAGDGKTDDTAALQRAIDEHRVVFVPKGTYAISRTLRLRPDTQLIGAHRCFTWFQPIAVPGGDFADRARPRPVIETADDGEAQTVLAFLGIRTLTDSQAAYCLRWRSGRKSIFRDVNIHFSFRAKPQGLQLPTDAAELARLYNQPLVLIEGNGGGRWYNFHQESSRGHGPDYRHLLIRGTREPLRLYHCNPEHARSRANLEIREARNVRLYGVKGEYYRPIVWIRDSDQVAVFGYGGNAAAAPGTALFVIENTPNFVLANLVDSPRFPSGQPETFFAGDGVDPRQWFMVRETAPDGRQLHTAPLERPVLYKRGRLGDELAGPR